MVLQGLLLGRDPARALFDGNERTELGSLTSRSEVIGPHEVSLRKAGRNRCTGQRGESAVRTADVAACQDPVGPHTLDHDSNVTGIQCSEGGGERTRKTEGEREVTPRKRLRQRKRWGLGQGPVHPNGQIGYLPLACARGRHG